MGHKSLEGERKINKKIIRPIGKAIKKCGAVKKKKKENIYTYVHCRRELCIYNNYANQAHIKKKTKAKI